nr:hypothetical protein [Tanacetum cinerariifolium]
MNFFSWLKEHFGNYHELDHELMMKLEEYWWGMKEEDESREDVGSNYLPNDDNDAIQANQEWRDNHEPMKDDDDIKDLDDYLIPNDASCYVDEEEERFKERKNKLLGIPYEKPPTFKYVKFEVIKYSLGLEEEYVAIKEYETRLTLYYHSYDFEENATKAPLSEAVINRLIAQCVADVLAEYETNRSCRNGNDNGNRSHDSGSGGRRTSHPTRECTYKDFLNCQPLNFKGIKGVLGLTQWFEKIESVFHISNCTMECQVEYATCTLLGSALTWWNSHVRTVGHDAAY